MLAGRTDRSECRTRLTIVIVMKSTDRSGPTVLVVQARVGSTRLPGKVLLPLGGKPLIEQVVVRASAIEGIDAVVVAVPDNSEQTELVRAVEATGLATVVRGPEDDVLDRTVRAAVALKAATVVRITSDCPLLDPKVSSAVLSAYRLVGVPYARTRMDAGFPRGFDTEVIALEALQAALEESHDPYEREHVTPFVWRQPARFPCVQVDLKPDRVKWRLTVDTPADYELVSAVYEELDGSGASHFGLTEITELFERRPELLAINEGVEPTPYIDPPGPR